MKKIILFLVVGILWIGLMGANSKSGTGNDKFRYAIVDTDPAAAGYWTDAIHVKYLKDRRGATNVYFSVRGTGDMIVTLQFRCPEDATWTDYDTYTVTGGWAGSRSSAPRILIVEDGTNVLWRAGVKDADYTSGDLIFGFDW